MARQKQGTRTRAVAKPKMKPSTTIASTALLHPVQRRNNLLAALCLAIGIALLPVIGADAQERPGETAKPAPRPGDPRATPPAVDARQSARPAANAAAQQPAGAAAA